MKLLFVCTVNRLRSPTAEAVFGAREGLAVRSAGLDAEATTPVSDELVAWADRIYVMENHHRNKLRKKFKKALGDTPVVTLHIPDEYEYMQPELVSLLKAKLPHYLPS